MKRPCNYPGCAALLDRGGYCERHKASQPKRHTLYNKNVRAKDPALALAHKIRKSAKWAKVRLQFLADHPICADPHGMHARDGTQRTAAQVHHIAGLIDRPDLWNNRDNLLAVCTACHARLEREVRSSPKDEPKAPPPQSSREWRPFG